MLCPKCHQPLANDADGPYLLPAPWSTVTRVMQVNVWLAAAAFLTWIAWRGVGGTAFPRGGHDGAAPGAASDEAV